MPLKKKKSRNATLYSNKHHQTPKSKLERHPVHIVRSADVYVSVLSHSPIDGSVNTLRPRQNGRHFADDIFKCIFENENEWISSRISLKFVPKVRITIIPALVQIMAWRRPGDKPLSEPMMVSLLTHIYVTRPQWVNSLAPGRFKQNFRKVIFKLILVNDGWGIFCKIAPRWMPLDLTDDKSTLVQIMAGCCQATSHYLSECWPRFMPP